MTRWYVRDWFEYEAVKNNNAYSQDIHNGLEEAVKRQLMSDVPYGVLLSGGLDSSVISAIAKKYAGKRVETDIKKMPGGLSSILLPSVWKVRPT